MDPEIITNGRFAFNALIRMLVPIGLGEILLLSVCIGVCVLVFHHVPEDHGDRWRPLSTSVAMGVWAFYCVKDTSCGVYDLALAVCGRYSYQQWGLLEFHEWTGNATLDGTGVNTSRAAPRRVEDRIGDICRMHGPDTTHANIRGTDAETGSSAEERPGR